MIPTSFDESNCFLSKPRDMSHDECEALSVWRGQDRSGSPVVISCWKLTKEELEELNRTGRVWLWISGVTMPPASITVGSPWTQQPAGKEGE